MPETHQPSTSTTGTVKTVVELNARFCCMQEKWAQTSTSPLPEGIRNAVMEFQAALVIQETAATQPLGAPVYNVQVSEGGKQEDGEGGKEEGKKAEEAGAEEMSDEERERRKKKNEKKRKRKAEKEKEKEKESTEEEQLNQVCTIPDDSSDDPPSRSSTGHVNMPTETPPSPASLQTLPTSSNDPVKPIKPTPTSSKPTTVLFTGDVTPATVKANGNEGVRRVRNPEKEDTNEVRTTNDTTGDNMRYPEPSTFDWADDVDATVTSIPVALVSPVARTPRDFSGLRSSTRNPWGSLS